MANTTDRRVNLMDVRISFAQGLFEAKAGADGGEPKFNSAFIFPKSHPAVALLSAMVVQVATEKWGAKATEVLTQLKASDKLPVHDGDAKASTPGYAGNLFLNASNKVKPLVVDTNPAKQLTAMDGKPYSGSYVNAIVEIWAQDNKFGKRINASLSGVQFVRDGERLAGGGVAQPTDFGVLPGAESVAATAPAADPAALFS
jgi:hypothetical protein